MLVYYFPSAPFRVLHLVQAGPQSPHRATGGATEGQSERYRRTAGGAARGWRGTLISIIGTLISSIGRYRRRVVFARGWRGD